MSTSTITLIVIAILLIFIAVAFIGVYNRLTVLRNGYENAFSQIDTVLTRRYDLIPNLIEVAKKYMEHEQETLENVVKARNQASQSLNNAKNNLQDNSLMEIMSQAENALSSSLGRLMAVVESYPDLKANEQMLQLSTELTNTENLILAHRQTYNECIKDFNNTLQVFPNNAFASFMSFKPAAWLPIEEQKRETPKVTF